MNNADYSEAESAGSLLDYLGTGLHAFAQPLAVLRAKLFLESVSEMDSTELKQLAQDSASQVERLCTLFNYLQEIVLAEAYEAKCAPLNLVEVIDEAVDGVEDWFRDSELLLEQNAEAAHHQVLADRSKLSQAISSVLLLVHGLSRKGEKISVSICTDGASLEIANPEAEVDKLSSEARLSLALIETNLRKQQGEFRFSIQPLRFSLRVPRAAITS